VAERWVLDQPTVAGVIIGARLGYKEHVKDNLRVFSVKLDEIDNAAITAVQVKK
jgi:aryl-alcohol dehydrogenase-like predicted oxidoreductase